MPDKPPIDSPLQGRRVALPESRQLDVLAELFERRGATVLRVPLVAILDSPRRQEVEDWLRNFIADTPDYLVILTGEGLRRLCGFAERMGMKSQFVTALGRVTTVCRGPKPGRALKEIGLQPDLLGAAPTTAGIIATLDGLDLNGRRLAVQLYGEDPNLPLQEYLRGRQIAFTTVAPYVYAPQSETRQVAELIDGLLQGRVDVIAFTSQPQLHRLLAVARDQSREAELLQALRAVKVAAVGPVVAEQLQASGIPVAMMPEDAFFMKPLVREIEKCLAAPVAAGAGNRCGS